VIGPAVSVGFNVVATAVIAAIDQHIAHAGGAHFRRRLFSGCTSSLSFAQNAIARVVDGRRVAAGGLAADNLASGIVIRRRALAIGRRPADGIAATIVEGALLHRRCGRYRERQQGQQDLGDGLIKK
jgi:hypothetical protein